MFFSKAKEKARIKELEAQVAQLKSMTEGDIYEMVLEVADDRDTEYQRKYNALLREYNTQGLQMIEVMKERNELLRKNNERAQADYDRAYGKTEQLKGLNVKALRSLCHPDKHNGSKAAHNMFIELEKYL